MNIQIKVEFIIEKMNNEVNVIPPGLEPGTLRVLGARDNRYTTESLIRERKRRNS